MHTTEYSYKHRITITKKSGPGYRRILRDSDQTRRNWSELLKIVSVYINKAISSDKKISDKLRQQHSTYAFGIATLESEIFNISSATKAKGLQLTFENQLFETNTNLLLNTCNFRRKFRFLFSLILSKNTQNLHFREAKFQNFPGEHVPGPRCVLAPSVLHPIFAGPTLNSFCQACYYYQWVIFSLILRILITQKHFSFFTRKRYTFRNYTEMHILRTADMRSAQA